MTNVKNVICQDFEHEMRLFITEELPAERIEFWKKHLLNCNECTVELKEELKVIAIIKEEVSVDLDDFSFNRMIDVAVSKRKSWVVNILGDRYNYAENKSFYGKAALVGLFATIAIIISLVTHQSIPVKNIPNDLLDWEGTKVISQINELKNTINLIHEDNWDKQIIMLDQRIRALEKEADKFSFN